MPLILPEGTRLPAGDDPYDLTADLRRMMESTTPIAVVPGTAGRTALLSALATAGRPASREDPVYVHQSDTGTTWKHDGTEWRAVGVPEILSATATPNSGATADSRLILSLSVTPRPYARRLVVNSLLHGSSITGTWDGALSVNASQVDGAQRYARFPQGVPAASVSMAMTYDLPADAASTVRLWVRRIGAAGTWITTSSAAQYTNIDVQAFQQ